MRHLVLVEPDQPAGSGRSAEHAVGRRRAEAARAQVRRVIAPDPQRDFVAGDKCSDEIGTVRSNRLRHRQRGGDDHDTDVARADGRRPARANGTTCRWRTPQGRRRTSRRRRNGLLRRQRRLHARPARVDRHACTRRQPPWRTAGRPCPFQRPPAAGSAHRSAPRNAPARAGLRRSWMIGAHAPLR